MAIESGINGFLQTQAAVRAEVGRAKPKFDPNAHTTQSEPGVDFAALLDANQKTARPAPSRQPQKQIAPSAARQLDEAPARPKTETPPPRQRSEAPQRQRSEARSSSTPERPAPERTATSQPTQTGATSQQDPTKQSQVRSNAARPERSDATPSSSRPETRGAEGLERSDAQTSEDTETTKQKATITPVALKQLGAIFTQDGSPAQKTPVLALLSGKVEQLDPHSIPELVTSNDFLVKAFQYGKVEDYMEQPLELGELLEAIEPSSDIMHQLHSIGMDLGQTVTPNQFLSAIGVDRQRVTSEIEVLKQSLQVQDGLAPYMIRSAKLRARLGEFGLAESVATADPETPGSVANQWDTNKASATDPRYAASQDPQVTAPTSNTRLLDQTPVASTTAATPAMVSAAATDDAPVTASAPNSATDQPMQTRATSSLAQHSANAPTEIPSADPLSNEDDAVAALGQRPASDDVRAVGTEGNSDAPRVRLATQNPFAALAARMQKDSPSGDAPLAAEEDVSIAQAFEVNRSNEATGLGTIASAQDSVIAAASEMQKGVQADRLPTPLEWLARQAEGTTAEAAPSQLGQQTQTQGMLGATNALKTPINGDAFAPAINVQPAVQTNEGIQLANALERMAFMPTSTEGSSTHSGTGGQSNGQQSMGTMGEGMTSPLSATASSTPSGATARSFATAMAETPEPKLDRAELVKQIADKAEMMLSERGGSMKIELGRGTAEKLEVAFQVDGDKLELKILAPNAEVRDALNQQLPKLKEALASQNLNLRDAQVGLGGGDVSHGGDQGSRQQFANENNQGSRNWQASLPARQAPRMTSYSPAARFQTRPNHQGRIQVMV